MRLLFLLSYFLLECYSYKFLVYNPIFGHSHTTFMGRIADTLFEAGHEVTVFSPLMDETLVNKTGLKSGAKLIRMKQDERTRVLMEASRNGMLKDVWTMNPDPIGMMKLATNMSKSFSYTCEAVASNTEILELLRAEKFDVGIAEPFSICGLGLFDYLNIPSSIGTLSCVQMDPISWFIGEPLAPSYVPAMSSTDGDNMDFIARLKNSVGTVLGFGFMMQTYAVEAEVLSEKFGKDYSNYGDLLGQTSFMFTNANPYLNYPRPVLHKTVEIGGISIDLNKVGELGEKWDKVLNERPHTVFISFGSVAKSKDMPSEWKKSILELCASMPEVTFIWKYEEPTTMADHIPNLHLSSWLPQNALLDDSRLSLFITHGGLGSTTEVAHFGKPSIMIPLFADQPRNAEMLARHGGALVLQKTDLAHPKTIRKSVETILNNKEFAESAARLAGMLRQQPISAKQLVISHSEFVAKFGPIPQLDPYGRQLNIFQYYLVDVIVFVLAVVSIVVYAIYFVFKVIIRRVCSAVKLKDD